MATEFKLPEVGEGITSGTVVGILVSVGDTISVDDPVLELETDKAVVEVPSSVAGVVTSINVKENQEAKIGQVVLTVEDAGGDAPAAKEEAKAPAPAKEEAAAPQAAPSPQGGSARANDKSPDIATQEAGIEKAAQASSATEAQKAPDSYQVPQEEKETVPAAPSVRRMAREMGINIRQVEGSGLLGRISLGDLERFGQGGTAAAAPSGGVGIELPPLPDFSKYGEVERESMSGIRKATVRQMALAWGTVPMVTHFDKADLTEFEIVRKRYAKRAETAGAKLTPTALLLKIVAGALKKYPKFNAALDIQNNEVVYKKFVHIGVAVDTERGLLVPVIRDVDKKGIIQLAVDLGEIAQKARDRKLTPDDMSGGGFSISNLGGIGGTGFTPIVNTPEVAILGVARGSIEPVWDKESSEFKPRMMMPISLTYDHRLIDGADAARFVRFICDAIEDPFLMAMEG